MAGTPRVDYESKQQSEHLERAEVSRRLQHSYNFTPANQGRNATVAWTGTLPCVTAQLALPFPACLWCQLEKWLKFETSESKLDVSRSESDTARSVGVPGRHLVPPDS